MKAAQRSRRSWALALALALLAVSAAPAARAQQAASGSASAQAERLFAEGKTRLAEQDFAHACPALDQSYRLDPATGTLLALAICREGEGKLASAVRAFREVVVRAEREGRADRASAARTKADSLEPTLSRLTIESQAPLAGISVWLDGAELPAAQLGTELSLDGGEHALEARAGSEVTWSTRVTLAVRGDHQHAVVPARSPPTPATQNAAVAPPAVARSQPSRAPQPPPRERWLTTGQWAGVIIAGAAVVAAGMGTGFALHAVSLDDDSASGCDGDLCTARARQKRLDARAAGNVATVSFAASATLITVGAAVFFASPPRSRPVDTAARSLGVWASGDGVGAALRQRF